VLARAIGELSGGVVEVGVGELSTVNVGTAVSVAGTAVGEGVGTAG